MDELHSCINELITHSDDIENFKDSKKIYRLLSQTELTDNDTDIFNEIIIPKLFVLINNKRVKADLVYLSLLPNNDGSLLQKIIVARKSSIMLNLTNPKLLFDYCLFKNHHWLLEIVENESTINSNNIFSDNVSSVVNTLKLINVTNQITIDLNKIKIHLREVNASHGNFVEFYVKELKRVLDVLNLCQKYISFEDNKISEFYHYVSNKSLLETFSKFLNLQCFDACDDILQKLKEYKSQTEYEIFMSYIIIFNILHCLKLCKTVRNNATVTSKDEISEIIKQTESRLVNLTNLSLQIKILENIFALLFLKNEHFILNDLETSSEFYCSENEVRLLLMFLKSACDKIKTKNPYNKTSQEFRRFTELNKHLADGLWRLELITDSDLGSSSKKKIENDIILYMLAPPESLIFLCLKQNDFNKAHQVIQIFNLQDSNIAAELKYNVKLLELKQNLKKSFKIQHLKKENLALQPQQNEGTVNAIIEEFFKSNPHMEMETNPTPDMEMETNPTPEQFSTNTLENLNFMNILDLAITQGANFEECQKLLDIALSYNTTDLNVESYYSDFCKKIQVIFTEVNNKHTVSIREILCSPEFDLDIETYKTREVFYSQLCTLCDAFNKQLAIGNGGKLNIKHVTHKTFLKLQELCMRSMKNEQDTKEQIKYLQRFLNYLKSFAKIFYVEQNNSNLISKGQDTSFFAILNHGRSEILAKLLFIKKLDISDFEQLFSKLKLDLVYHVAKIFFPKIDLSLTKPKNLTEYTKPAFSPNNNIISYVQRRNWLLAFILSEMYKIEGTKLDLNEIRIKTFVNYVKLPRIQHLKTLYNNNEVVTALQQQFTSHSIGSYFEQHIIKSETEHHSILSSQISTGSFETGEEMFEGDLKITNWKHLFDIVDSVPQNQLQNSKELLDLRDMILSEMVGDCFEPDYFGYVQFISDNRLRWDCILNNMTTWPGEFCLEVIRSELSRFTRIDEVYEEKFMDWCEKIQLYENIRIILQKNSWFEVFLRCKNKPHEVIQNLLNTVEVDLLLNFIELHEVNVENLLIIDETYFVALFDSNVEMSKIQDLLNKLPVNQIIQICYTLLKVLKKLDHLDFIASYISKSDLGDSSLFKSIQISLKILSCFNSNEQEQLWCLVTEPISIIEVLIMNTKLDKLGQVLEKIKNDIENCEFDENQISVEKLDEMLRAYAEKSLEFRVILQPGPRLVKTPESSKLLQSLDSANFPCGRKFFVIPEIVPDKSEWVQNHEVTECMCCMETIFSMFNRRHHCRRCGRVICGTCSLKRMQVPTYGDIRVRICLDCYEQSHQDGAGTSSSKSEVSTRSIGCDYWLLTNDPNHNQIVREEFSFEYAPSVSLCLAILKHHSKTEEYPRFLLDQCDGMLRLLQPTNSEATQEIDYLLVIKMLKSLAIAAKMLSAQCMLQWGTSLADRILSQADLLGLLAERGCLHLIPTCGQIQGRYIDAGTLRRLRDKLLEGEQWNLALEVSTKAGLDNSGVFAAWGKSYLKAGSLQLAREKFQRCFDKTAHYDTSTELSDSFSSVQLPQIRSRPFMMPENRPTKNPPLLNEIIQILESNTCVIDPKILKDVKNAKPLSVSTWSLSSSVNLPLQNDPAVCILNKLKNLSSIAAGNYCAMSDCSDSVKSLNITKPHLEPIFYEECVYYLSKYGTHMSLLEFYIKHGDIYECLKYMFENRLSSDVFIEIYMLCLRENLATTLQENMSKIDSTLDVWKTYLKHICRHLEKYSQLHSLYQLQQFMGDFVRAAMTCIKFYKDGAVTYSELSARIDYLHKAQQHLQQELEQEQWVEVATVRKSSMDSQDSFEAKGIANPSLVMKMDSKNVDKHINTIWRQIEVAKFLAECESSETPVLQILPEILPFINEDLPADDVNKVKIPTLFGSYYERVQLAVLAIVCGNNVEDGFGIAFRIIHDYKLSAVKVYCQAGKQLAKTERYTGIAQLVSCIRSSGVSDSAVTDMCDEMLILAVQTLTKANATGPQLDGLIKLITDRAAKISAYIESKQLKSAYLLAVKQKRMGDIRRILREAEFLNQPNIKALCQKVLHLHSHSPSHSKD